MQDGQAQPGGDHLHARLDAVLEVCASLSSPRPLGDTLNELLAEARRLTGAEAGTVYLKEREALRFVCSQNSARPDLEVAVSIREGSGGGLRGGRLPVTERSIAGFVALSRSVLRLDDVYALPEGAPYSFDRSWDVTHSYRTRSMLVAPLLDHDRRVVGVLQLINRRAPGGREASFESSDEALILGLASIAAVSVRNSQLREELERSHLDTIFRLATAAEFRDGETSQHIRRVSLYCETIARSLGLDQEHTRLMLFASPMHDVGKLGVPDAILLKPGRLTEDEFEVMKRHTTIGAKILEGAQGELMAVARRVALSHHERWDGAGYPNGVRADAIPIEGRITAVADVFDALTSRRRYKEAFTLDWALGEIERNAGTQFDPQVVDAFLRAREDVEAVHETYREPDTVAVDPDHEAEEARAAG